MSVEDVESKGLELGLACGQVLDVAGGDGVVPGDDAACAVGGVGGDAGGERSQSTGRRCDGADAMDVGQVDVGEVDGAGVGEAADGSEQLGERAGDIGGVDDWRVVGAGDGDADCTSRAIDARNVVSLRDRGADAQIIKSTIGCKGPHTRGVDTEIAD